MEHAIFEPDTPHRAPRHTRVELEDLQYLPNEPLVNRGPTTPSAEYVDLLWQREAAMASLRGIYANLKPGIHRRQETFAEIARDEIGTRWRRARRFMGGIAARMADHILPAPRDSYAGSLDDVLGADEEYAYDLHEFMGTMPEAPVSPAVVAEHQPQPEDEWLSPLAASRYFTQDELDAMRRAVAATHPPRSRGTLYRSEYAANSRE